MKKNIHSRNMKKVFKAFDTKANSRIKKAKTFEEAKEEVVEVLEQEDEYVYRDIPGTHLVERIIGGK